MISQLYQKWEEKRMEILQEELDLITKKKRLANLEKLKEDLKIRERTLTFFENEENIELQIQKKLEREEELYGEDLRSQGKEVKDAPYPEAFEKRHEY